MKNKLNQLRKVNLNVKTKALLCAFQGQEILTNYVKDTRFIQQPHQHWQNVWQKKVRLSPSEREFRGFAQKQYISNS